MKIQTVLTQDELERRMEGDRYKEDPARIMEKAMLSHDVELALAKIGEQEAKVVRMRYGLGGRRPMTLAEIAKKIKLSRERVRQIEDRALLRFRRHAARMGLIELAPHPQTDLRPDWAIKK